MSPDRRRTIDDRLDQLGFMFAALDLRYKTSGPEEQAELSPGLSECREQLIPCLRPSQLTSAELASQLHDPAISFAHYWLFKRRMREDHLRADIVSPSHSDGKELPPQWHVLNSLINKLDTPSRMVTEAQLEREQQPRQEVKMLLEDIRTGRLGQQEAKECMDKAQSAISTIVLNDPLLRDDPVLLDSLSTGAASNASKSVSTPKSKTMFMHYTISEDRSGNDESVKSALLASLGKREQLQPQLAVMSERALRLP